MRTIKDVKNALSKHKASLLRAFNLKEISVFGSCVRGEMSEDSDIDILVDFVEPISLFSFLDLEERLQGILGAKVDLVSKDALKPIIGARILKEAVAI